MPNIINLAIDHLSKKSCSEAELREYLATECHDPSSGQEPIDKAIAYLKEHHLINDLRVAEQLALRHEHKGNRFITQILQQRHIAEAVIKQTLLNIADEKTRALAEGRKKISTLAHLGLEETKTALARFLSGRQFSLNTINSVIEKLTSRRPYQLKYILPFYRKAG